MVDEPDRSSGGYWVLRGASGCFYDCARFDDPRHTALCVFDRREAAEENAGSLDEAQMFLNTLELHGTDLPACVKQEPLLPEPVEVTGRELWGIIESLGVGYVTVNPPPSGTEVKTFRLQPSESFRPA